MTTTFDTIDGGITTVRIADADKARVTAEMDLIATTCGAARLRFMGPFCWGGEWITFGELEDAHA
jgi:predicted ThiF/HesA family dinucleotide-utilizing enzyme